MEKVDITNDKHVIFKPSANPNHWITVGYLKNLIKENFQTVVKIFFEVDYNCLDPYLALTQAFIESRFNTNAKNDSSSAEGVFQFLNIAWIDNGFVPGKDDKKDLDKSITAYIRFMTKMKKIYPDNYVKEGKDAEFWRVRGFAIGTGNKDPKLEDHYRNFYYPQLVSIKPYVKAIFDKMLDDYFEEQKKRGVVKPPHIPQIDENKCREKENYLKKYGKSIGIGLASFIFVGLIFYFSYKFVFKR